MANGFTEGDTKETALGETRTVDEVVNGENAEVGAHVWPVVTDADVELARAGYVPAACLSLYILFIMIHVVSQPIRNSYVPAALKDLPLQTSAVRWADIGGLHAVRATLKETLEMPTKYARLFVHAPLKLRSGILLYGPPGCGKTLLASAVARECGLNMIAVKGPELLNKYIGASEASVREVNRPCCRLFFITCVVSMCFVFV